MPARNRVKTYVKDGYYHIYNRGVAKLPIFLDSQDFQIFLKYLSVALSPEKANIVTFNLRGQSFKAVARPIKNYQREIDLLAFCLIPNHFHLLVKQCTKNSMESFIRSIITRYAQYFNKKYDRVGPVFQGRYKAALIENDRYLLHLSRYIHLNPFEYTKDLTKAYSSYADYLRLRKTKWLKTDIILNFFEQQTIPEVIKVNSYKNFVETHKKDREILGELTLE